MSGFDLHPKLSPTSSKLRSLLIRTVPPPRIVWLPLRPRARKVPPSSLLERNRRFGVKLFEIAERVVLDPMGAGPRGAGEKVAAEGLFEPEAGGVANVARG